VGGALTVTDEAIEKIKAMITSGALRAGDRLPREADLARSWATVHIAGVEQWLAPAP
jgi:DNA-binding FadR family transcriptional regulator